MVWVHGWKGYGMSGIKVHGANPTVTSPLTGIVPIASNPISSWSVPTGLGVYMSCVVDEHLLGGSMTLRNAGAQPTGLNQVLFVISPFDSSYSDILVPTSTGATSVVGSDGYSGGGDISDLIEIDLGDGITRVAAVCFSDYKGWNISTYGRFPAYLVFERNDTTRQWSYDASRSKTTDQLYNDAIGTISNLGDLIETRTNSFSENYRFNPGFNEIALCPVSGHILVTCYYPSTTTQSGSVVAIDPDTSKIVAWSRIPDYTDPTTGHNVGWSPREIQSDPSSITTTRTVVLADCYDITAGGTSLPHTMIEIVYNPATPAFSVLSNPCLPLLDGTDWACAGWSASGVLYAATHNNVTGLAGLASRALNVFRVGDPLTVSAYGSPAQPSFTVASMGASGAVPFTLEIDPITGTVITVGAFGGRIESWTPDSPDVDRADVALNPTFAANVTNWSGRLLTSGVAWDSGDSGRLKCTGNGSAGTMSCRQTQVNTTAAQEGQSLSIVATIRGGAVNANVRCGIDFVNSGGTIISSVASSYRPCTSGSTTFLRVSATIPLSSTGATAYRPFVEWDSNANGQIQYVLDNHIRFDPGTQRPEIFIQSTLFVTGQSNFRRGGILDNHLITVLQPYDSTHAYPSAPYDLDSYIVSVPINYLNGVGLKLTEHSAKMALRR